MMKILVIGNENDAHGSRQLTTAAAGREKQAGRGSMDQLKRLGSRLRTEQESQQRRSGDLLIKRLNLLLPKIGIATI